MVTYGLIWGSNQLEQQSLVFDGLKAALAAVLGVLHGVCIVGVVQPCFLQICGIGFSNIVEVQPCPAVPKDIFTEECVLQTYRRNCLDHFVFSIECDQVAYISVFDSKLDEEKYNSSLLSGCQQWW